MKYDIKDISRLIERGELFFFVGAGIKLGEIVIHGVKNLKDTLSAENIPEGLDETITSSLKQTIKNCKEKNEDDDFLAKYVEQRLKAIDTYFAD